MTQIRLVLAIHNHQPVGNFDGVFEAAYQDSYLPFLEIVREYPEIPISLHNSGSLLEWLVEAHPEYIDLVRSMVESGQIEIIGGAFYEPILSGIPRRDRLGQIVAFSEYLEQLFGTRVRGMWVPERVWEQTFASDIAEAGIEYTILDDFHFRSAGLRDEQLSGYYQTEDEGWPLMVFPGSEKLRYTIPFADPQDTIDHLGLIAHNSNNPVVTFGDDGEKFGTWPKTKQHVYRDGWLRRFLDALSSHSDWLKVSTLCECVDHVSPIGKCYLPDSSYREMTEWALPVARQAELDDLNHQRESDADWPRVQQFMRGGFWRNFQVKYPEANEMYSRMLLVSRRLQKVSDGAAGLRHPDKLFAARNELYRAQCNCAYWHGAFGGLYLPHLRNAVYKHLISADAILESVSNSNARWVSIEASDLNQDVRKEIRIDSDRLTAFLAPARGGHLYELDVRSIRHNLLATLDRRPEVYHEKVRNAGNQDHTDKSNDDETSAESIHDLVQFKQPDLDKKLVYDNWPRKSLVDHFLQPGLTLDEFIQGGGEMGDFLTGVYESTLRRSDDCVEVRMTRNGHFGPQQARVTKTVGLNAESGSVLDIAYDLENLTPGIPIHFAVEFNFAGMAAGESDRYFYDASGHQLGQLETVQSLDDTGRIGLVDEWLGLDVAVDSSIPTSIWAFPIQTISQSEGGFELVHQSAAVVPHWELIAPENGRWSVRLKLTIDTSIAQARQLGEASATVSS